MLISLSAVRRLWQPARTCAKHLTLKTGLSGRWVDCGHHRGAKRQQTDPEFLGDRFGIWLSCIPIKHLVVAGQSLTVAEISSACMIPVKQTRRYAETEVLAIA